MSKTVTDELAVLLRKAAEKWPEKFEISLMGTVFALDGDNSLPGFYIRHHDRIDEPENFTLDHMDAIAEAVGMEFMVTRYPDGVWSYTLFAKEGPFQWRIEFTPYPSKREASIAALCAILKYKLENP